ncbi:MAG: hypothetical protein PGN15_09120 [Aeromicrobium erythreum]
MVEEGTTPADEARSSSQPRVVKKVVKKTVVRPVAPPAPAPRETRPAPPRATAVSRLKGKDAKAAAPADAPAPPTPAAPRGPRATVDVGAGLAHARDRVGDAVHSTGELARRLGFAVRDRGEDAVWAVRDYRVPTVPPLGASVVTGLVAGLLVTAGGWLCLELFSAVRGTSAGGAFWGLLAVLVVVGVAGELGARLLRAFGVQQARPVLALSVLLVAIVVMLAFLEPVDGPWAWLIVPGLMVVTVPLVQRLLVWAATDVPPDDAHR